MPSRTICDITSALSDVDCPSDRSSDTVSYDGNNNEQVDFEFETPEDLERKEIWNSIWPIHAVEYGSKEVEENKEKCDCFLKNGNFIDVDDLVKMATNESKNHLD